MQAASPETSHDTRRSLEPHVLQRKALPKQALLWNAGGGVTQIVMPYMTEGIARHVPEYEAWRWAFFLPGCLYIVITFLILTLGQVCRPSACLHCLVHRIKHYLTSGDQSKMGTPQAELEQRAQGYELCLWLQDCPDGNYASLERSGKKQKSKPWRELYNGFCNYRMWGLAACYAYSFGVEVRDPPPSLHYSLMFALLSRCAPSPCSLHCALHGAYSCSTRVSGVVPHAAQRTLPFALHPG